MCGNGKKKEEGGPDLRSECLTPGRIYLGITQDEWWLALSYRFYYELADGNLKGSPPIEINAQLKTGAATFSIKDEIQKIAPSLRKKKTFLDIKIDIIRP